MENSGHESWNQPTGYESSNVPQQVQRKKIDVQKVDMFMMMNAKYFESHQLHAVRDRLLALDESRWTSIQMLQLKDPTTSLIISLFGGSLGIDRFYIGDTGLGIAKLLTCGGFYIWTIIDWFLIMGVTREKNMEMLQEVLY